MLMNALYVVKLDENQVRVVLLMKPTNHHKKKKKKNIFLVRSRDTFL